MARNKDKAENVFARPEVPVEKVEEPKEYKVWAYEEEPAPIVEQTNILAAATPVKIIEEEDTTMNAKSDEKRFIFYYGFYSVNHAIRKGEYMEPLHTKTGETRKCPCNSIAIELDNVYDLVMNGYIVKNLDKSLFRGRSITKKNINDYITYITNMINNGFLKEQ